MTGGEGEAHFRTSFRFIRTIKRGQHRTYAETRHFHSVKHHISRESDISFRHASHALPSRIAR